MQTEPSNPHAPPLFPLGQLLATPAALRLLADHRIQYSTLLQRHSGGDWGDLDEYDCHQNHFAIRAGLRILSSYRLSGADRVWIITEADRSCTTILLPEEY
jgi:hypothetical protein